ncbi:twin transmembrane helix small protein [Aerophototrophica crusticola]|uniref:Twin transmembrane helix small protein n=1 Tax=Aerophototrophica crusticola TaxID=1709002 RepID=A0A858R364_9PROT|nr:twin transmembrane helix small protein [Rhodospirillaceae bacterium B3]
MSGFLIFLLITAMLATLAVLVMGLFAMARGGEFNERHGNRLMWWRVRLQVLALVLFALAFLSSAA